MSKDTEYNHYNACKEILRDLYSMARIYHLSHEQLIQAKNSRLFNSNHYQRITQHHQGCIFAQDEILFNNLFQYHLVYLYQWIDGRYYTSEEIQSLPNWVSWEYYTKFTPQLLQGYYWGDNRNKPF